MPLSHFTTTHQGESFYYESLQQIIQKIEIKSNKSGVIRSINNTSSPRFVVTHDFKGGYQKSNYSFQWLASVDTFTYFSHHRVSIPPAEWISAAKTHHTRILGTLIFERDAIDEFELLINGPKLPSDHSLQDPPANYYLNLSSPYDFISTYFADRLIDLAIHHGFHGWLLNFELDLLKLLPNRVIPTLHALKIWVEYFRLQGRMRVGPSWEVCWYDSVSYLDGSLKWQSQLHPQHNLPFFSSSSSIFLDYHWSPQHISATQAVVQQLLYHLQDSSSIHQDNRSSPLVEQDQDSDIKKLDLNWQSSLARCLIKKPPSEEEIKQSIYFGVDVFGRGTRHGGGFSSWKAAREVLDAGFSVALFAPGWTWESESLAQDRADFKEGDPQWWSRWWRDERYFWSGLLEKTLDKDKEPKLVPSEPPNAYSDSIRIAMEAKKPKPRKGVGASELPQHKAFLDLFPARQDYISEFFHTNWSLGTGHGFWVQGQHHYDPIDGIGDWSDMSMNFPIHDLSVGGGKVRSASGQGLSLAQCDLIQDIGWSGSGSIKIQEELNHLEPPSPPVKYLWMNTTSVQCASKMKCRLIWRPIEQEDGSSPLGMVFQTCDVSGRKDNTQDSKVSITHHPDSSLKLSVVTIDLLQSSDSSSTDLNISQIQTHPLAHGWFQSTCHLETNASSPKIITRVGITACTQSRFSHHLGEFSLVPMEQRDSSTATQLEQLQLEEGGVVERPLKVTWEQDAPTDEYLSDKGDTSTKNRLSGKIRWETEPVDEAQRILIWLVYLAKQATSVPSENRPNPPIDHLIAVVKDIQELGLSLPHPYQTPPRVSIVGVHFDYSQTFTGSCTLL